jgi:hypothetical protein
VRAGIKSAVACAGRRTGRCVILSDELQVSGEGLGSSAERASAGSSRARMDRDMLGWGRGEGGGGLAGRGVA